MNPHLRPKNIWFRVQASFRARRRLLLVADNAGWIIDQVANRICAQLPRSFRATTVTGEWQYAANCIIHFINRAWVWGDAQLEQVALRNLLIGLWWHGLPNSPDSGVRASFQKLREIHHLFCRIQVPCSTSRDAVLAAGVSLDRIVLLPEGVDTQVFKPSTSDAYRDNLRSQLGIPPHSIAVGCFQKDGVGWGDGMEPKLVKGPDVLAEVLTRLRKDFPIFAVIPGPSRGYLKDRLDAAGVPYWAPGFVDSRSFPTYYHALDIYLSPSREEGGPVGALESMASGVPLVATRTGMPVDLIVAGTNGLLSEIEDIDGLVGAIAELIFHPTRRQQMAINALETIRGYDWSVLGPRYIEELYQPVWNSLP